MAYDYIIVGAGIAGITVAEQLANVFNKKVLLIDKRDHIGGNCYDYYDEHGILVHKYGPHIFHTNSQRVFEYLSLYTTWNVYNHKVLGKIGDVLAPIPFNLISIEKCLVDDRDAVFYALFEQYQINEEVTILDMKKSDDEMIRRLADYVYENVFLHYTQKQWDLSPEELDPSVTARVPVRISYDCRYFTDKYQRMPANGYTAMFENMLSNHNITILLDKDYHEILDVDFEAGKIYFYDEKFNGKVIFTGMIDEFFDYRYGRLPYRSLVLVDEHVDERFFQTNATINYPNDYHFTRITEYKYITGQEAPTTSIQLEYPTKYDPDVREASIPYYPIPQEENQELYDKYKMLADEFDNVKFIGRLAEYRYLNMDRVVEEVLDWIQECVEEVLDE